MARLRGLVLLVRPRVRLGPRVLLRVRLVLPLVRLGPLRELGLLREQRALPLLVRELLVVSEAWVFPVAQRAQDWPHFLVRNRRIKVLAKVRKDRLRLVAVWLGRALLPSWVARLRLRSVVRACQRLLVSVPSVLLLRPLLLSVPHWSTPRSLVM